MHCYDCYLFDADGTLFDTVDLICNCFDYIAVKYRGEPIPRDEIIAGIGSPLAQMVGAKLGSYGRLEEILADYQRYQYEILADTVTLFPGASETLAVLQQRGSRLAVVTSRRRPSMLRMLQLTGLERYFQAVVTPEDTRHHKPDPAPVQKALALLQAEAATALMVGDAHFDISAGAAAGVDTAFVSWSRTKPADLPTPAVWVIDSLSDLLAC